MDPLRLCLLLGIASPAIALVAVMLLYCVDVPFSDQWLMVEDLTKLAQGSWGLGDWIEPYNGHRLIVPRLIWLPLAFATDWDTRLELPVVLLCAFGIYAVLHLSVRDLATRLDLPALYWVLPVVSLVVFSLTQWENWLWGWSIQTLLCVFFALAAIYVLSRPDYGAVGLGAGLLFSVLAMGSFAAGLALWPLGALVLAQPWQAPHLARGRSLALALWCSAGAVVLWAYLHAWPGEAAIGVPVRAALARPLELARFFLALLGAPLASPGGLAPRPEVAFRPIAVGAAGMLVLAGATLSLVRRFGSQAFQPLLAWSLFSLGAVMQIALARVELGVGWALHSRYMTLVTPFWAATVIALGVLAFSGRSPRGGARGAFVARGALAVCAVLVLVSSVKNIPAIAARYDILSAARRELPRAEIEVLLARIGPADYVRSQLAPLARLGFSVFRENVHEPFPVPPAPLPRFDQVLALRTPLRELSCRARVRVPMSVHNPTEHAWPTSGAITGSSFVTLSYHWQNEHGRQVVFDGERTALPRDVYPGDTLDVDMKLKAPRRNGDYVLRVTLVQEGVAWFEERGATPLDVRVAVRDCD